MRMKKLIILYVMFAFWAGGGQAQQLSHLAGAFADLPLGVRPAGMGGAYTALSSDGNAVFYNPAAAALVSYASLTATTSRIFNIVPATFIGIHYPTGKISWVAGIQQVGDDLLKETTAAAGIAVKAEDLLPHYLQKVPFFDRMAFSATFRFRLASFGNNEEGGENRITGDGRGYAIDLGYYVQVNGLRFGLTLHDAVGQFRWNSSGRGNYVQNIPTRLSLGLAYAERRLRFALDVQPSLYEDLPDRVQVGLEANVTMWLVLRGGITQDVGGQSLNKSMTLGFGVYSLSWKKYRLAIQGGYRTGQLNGTYQFAIDLFWPGRK
ncbi:MAG: hypothetical protein D6814_09855 [Calditrichaeota bacterium]|nr:MAG: hypothetical protein D6814_09855 [Calditrichota bacterium]